MTCPKCESELAYEPPTSDGSGRTFPAAYHCTNEDCPAFGDAIDPDGRAPEEYDLIREAAELDQVRRTGAATEARTQTKPR